MFDAGQCESGSTPFITRELFEIKKSNIIKTFPESGADPSLFGLGKRIGEVVTLCVGHHDKKHVEQ